MYFLRIILISLFLLFTDFESFKPNPASGKIEFRVISESKEIEIGEKYFPILKNTFTIESSDLVNEYVQKVGQKIAKFSDRPDLPYEFIVVDEPTINAACVPGGKIYIYKGLLVELNSEAELAAVLAHEIAHANLRHGAKAVERVIYQLGLMDGLDRVMSLISLKCSRDAELEADLYSIKYMKAAGYDVQGSVDLQETLISVSKPSNGLMLFRTHPSLTERRDTNAVNIQNYPKGGYIGTAPYQKIVDELNA